MTLIDDDLLKGLEEISAESRIVTKYVPFEGLPTGSLALDWALGGKGLMRGGYTLFCGDPGSGKSSLALLAGATTVADSGKVAVLNMEYRWNVEHAFASGMGYPGQHYLLLEPRTAEDALNYVVYLAKQGFDLVIVDSVAAMSPQAEMDSELEDQHVMLINRILSSFFRRASRYVALGQTAVLFITQFRTAMSTNPKYPAPPTRYGGKALGYYTSIGVDLFKPEMEYALKTDQNARRNPIGMFVAGRTWKNTVGPNAREIGVHLRFAPGLSVNRVAEIADFGKRFKVLTSKNGGAISGGAHWFYNSDLLGKTRVEAMEAIKQDKDLQGELTLRIRQAMAERQAEVVVEEVEEKEGDDE